MDDIITIDCHYLDQPEFAAAYLMTEGEEAAFIDNNTNHALPRLLRALDDAGLSPQQVRYLIVTHVHLDHAGATSALAKACPNAVVLAHPRAVCLHVAARQGRCIAQVVVGDDEAATLFETARHARRPGEQIEHALGLRKRGDPTHDVGHEQAFGANVLDHEAWAVIA